MLRLTKHHGLGNDFLVALAADNPDLEPDPDEARLLCDRHLGVGADGLLLALAPGGTSADAHMVLLNADGSEAEISGNGIRCLGQALLRSAGRSEGELLVETAAGLRRLRTVRGDVDGTLWMEVDLGPARPGLPPGPVAAAYPARERATVDIGNPHLVLLVDSSDAVELERDGPVLEASIPGGVNVEVVEVLDAGHLALRVWERGAGLTRACGSGAAAAVAAARRWGLVGDRVLVSMPGGDVEVELADGSVLLTGPTTFVAEVMVP